MELTDSGPSGAKTGQFDFITTRLEAILAWGRKNSLWPMPFATACCGIELMATAASRFDIARFGAEAMRFTPRWRRAIIRPVVFRHTENDFVPVWKPCVKWCTLSMTRNSVSAN